MDVRGSDRDTGDMAERRSLVYTVIMGTEIKFLTSSAHYGPPSPKEIETDGGEAGCSLFSLGCGCRCWDQALTVRDEPYGGA